MQHLKILHIEYAANLRVHLASKFAAHFSQIAFCLQKYLYLDTFLFLMPNKGVANFLVTLCRGEDQEQAGCNTGE